MLTFFFHLLKVYGELTFQSAQMSSYAHKHVFLHLHAQTNIDTLLHKQGWIHGHQLRTGGQGRKCAFSHFSTRA